MAAVPRYVRKVVTATKGRTEMPGTPLATIVGR